MTEGTSSCRPARLVRFRDTTGAMGDGLTTRFNALDEALATYRATCEAQYRLIPTAETTDLLHEWRSALVELGEWTGEVGASFIRTQVVDAYTDDELWVPDLEGPITMDDDDVVDGMDDKYHDDPFLGVPPGGWQLEDMDVSAEDPDALADLLEELGLPTQISAEALKGFNDVLDQLPPGHVAVTLRFESDRVLFMADGRVLYEMTRAEASVRFLFPGHAPSSFVRTSRFLGRLSGALDFATGAYTQWQEDEGIPLEERLLRAGTKGSGLLGGGILGGAAGGFLGGAAAGTVCGPGAPVCSGVLSVGGALVFGILGSSFGGWLSDQLPWMGDDEPLPGEYDLDLIEDELAQTDGNTSGDLLPLVAATHLIGMDIALAETQGQPDVHAELPDVLPDRDGLIRTVEGIPEPREELAPPTGTTVPDGPPEPSPGPAPEPFPESPPTGTTVPQG